MPDFQSFMLPVLREAAEGRGRVSEAIARTADGFGLTAEERAELLGSGRQTRVANRVNWAFTYLNKAGLIERTGRGEYRATPAGRAVLANPPAKISIAYLQDTSPAFREFREKTETRAEASEDGEVAPTQTPEERLQEAHRAMQAGLSVELLDRLRALAPARFEVLIVDLLLSLGFGGGRRGERIGMSGDGGVDGIIREDALGLDVVYIQAKRYAASQAVGPEAIQAFAGSLLERGASKGVFATTSRFTEGARRAAERLSTQRRLVLIDGDELSQLMIEHGVGVRTVESLRIQRVDLSPYEEDA
ncbi:restriction endonuclease [Roseococcus sp. DSY-14]|uniref:restriction endonuclease n=1 Tax=Roseococcus sp. DSY-14 TaxID=3369650 RepID=UPI00387B6DD2